MRPSLQEEAWFTFKLSVTFSLLLPVVLAILFSPLLIGLVVEHGHASPLWFLGLPVSFVPTLMILFHLEDWDPAWLR